MLHIPARRRFVCFASTTFDGLCSSFRTLVGASICHACFPGDGTTVDKLRLLAEAVLCAAKRAGAGTSRRRTPLDPSAVPNQRRGSPEVNQTSDDLIPSQSSELTAVKANGTRSMIASMMAEIAAVAASWYSGSKPA